MKKSLVLAAVLVTLSTSASSALAANQIHLAVGDCGGPAVVENACTSNRGAVVLAISAVPGFASTQVIGFEAYVEAVQGSVLSDWWRSDAPGCHDGGVLADANFVTSGTLCNDIFAGAAPSGQAIYYPDPGPIILQPPLFIEDHAILYDVFAEVNEATPMTMDASTEYSLFHIVLLNSKTVGTGACGGCNDHLGLDQGAVSLRGQP